MRTVLSQSHSQNLRDLIIEYELDKSGKRIIDFTYGKGGLWEIEYPYRCELTKCDAVPTAPDVKKKDMTKDDYSDLGDFDAGVFDPPYLYGREAFDYSRRQSEGKNAELELEGWSAGGDLARFVTNESEAAFIERLKGLDRAALQCLKKDALLIIKIMDTRVDGWPILNHILCISNLSNFRSYATFVYISAGASTWKNHAQTAHGYWLVLQMMKDGKQQTL